MNLFIGIIYLILTFSLTLITYKNYGKNGLFIFIVINIIVSNIQTVKIASIFGLTTSLGNITYGAIFLATDIINEKYGIEESKKIIKISFFSMIMFTLLMNIFLMFEPSSIDMSQEALSSIFKIMPRITIASLTAYFISQNIDAILYKKIKEKYNKLYLSNNISTIISQFIDTCIFTSIAFLGILKFNEIIELIITMLFFKIIIALLDTPFMYMVNKIKNIKEL